MQELEAAHDGESIQYVEPPFSSATIRLDLGEHSQPGPITTKKLNVLTHSIGE